MCIAGVGLAYPFPPFTHALSNGGSLHAAKRSCKPIPLGLDASWACCGLGFQGFLGHPGRSISIQEDQPNKGELIRRSRVTDPYLVSDLGFRVWRHLEVPTLLAGPE